jgi:hypothetical protein
MMEAAPGMVESPFTSRSTNSCSYHLWGGADYLLWWVRGAPLQGALVTSGNPADPLPGALGQPGTRVLVGDSTQSFGPLSGVRLVLGGWLDSNRTIGIEASGFALQRSSTTVVNASNAAGSPPIYVPFNNTNPALAGPDSVTIADPVALFNGHTYVTSQFQLWGAEANGVFNLVRRNGMEFNLLAGFRYADLKESLNITTSSTDQVFSTVTNSNDNFATRNQFYGGQLGGKLSVQQNNWFLDLTGKVALGDTHQTVNIAGQSVQSGPFAPTPGTFPGGIFTQPTNIGHYTHNNFSVLPAMELKIGYQLTNWMRVFAGYDYMYWTDVVRPGQQLDHNVNTSQSTVLSSTPTTLNGPGQPTASFNHSDFWAQGVTFGVEFRW